MGDNVHLDSRYGSSDAELARRTAGSGQEDQNMTRLVIGLLAGALTAGPLVGVGLAQPKEIFIPLLVYRTGPYAVQGIPIANGFVDYFTLINERDEGINGVKLTWEECETEYDTKKGVECYERLKGKNPALVNPYTTPVTYQLVPRTPVDKIPILTMGYGMVAAADGRWFPWVFNFPTSYWNQASAVIRYIGQREGGLDKLKGRKIVHIFLNNAYGKEANPTLEALARQLGFQLTLLAVNVPGQEQQATWRQVRRINPNWIFLSGWGVMNQVAIKEAVAINYPMDHFIGNWWSASDPDVIPAGAAAKGYIGATFHAPGTEFRVHEDVVKHVYDKGKGAGKRKAVGGVLYNRGLVNGMFSVEAIRTAMTEFGNKPLTGEQVRWGLEHLNLTEKRLEELGMKGFTHALKISCQDHEGAGPVMFEQWDGKKWNTISGWIPVMRDIVRPKLEAAAAEEGKKLGYTMRDCSKAGRNS
jgi:branched-chain amino acid transport system substrate-binding protein